MPLFQVGFEFTDVAPTLASAKLTAFQETMAHALSPLDFVLEVDASQSSLTLFAHYNVALYSSRRAVLMLEQLEQLCRLAVASPDSSIVSASLITPSQIGVIPDPVV